MNNSQKKNSLNGTIFIMTLAVCCMACVSFASEPSNILKLGFRLDAAPFSYCSSDEIPCPQDQIRGYSVDICDRIAKKAVEYGMYTGYEFVPVTAENRFKSLDDDKIDILCGATTVTLRRISNYNNTFWTFLSGASLMNSTRFGEISDDDLKNLKIGVLKGTTTIEKLQNNHSIPDENLRPVESHLEGLQLFLDGDIQVYYADREILLELREKAGSKGVQSIVARKYFTNEPYALFLRDNEKDLLLMANYTLLDLFKGDIEKIFFKNFRGKIMSRSLRDLFQLQQVIVEKDALQNLSDR